MNRNPLPQQTLQRLPKKWAVAIVVALIVYALVQPFANSRFGWGLPSLAGMLGMEKPAAKSPVTHNSSTKNHPSEKASGSEADDTDSGRESDLIATEASSQTVTRNSDADSDSSEPEDKPTSKRTSKPPESNSTSLAQSSETKTSTKPTADDKQASSGKSSAGNNAVKQADAKPTDSKPAESKQTKANASSDLLYGLLKDTGREVYVSPAGLRYTRGSEEGHRLKHLEKHLKDIPDRPGKHGVFDGDMAQALRWIDDAYTRGKQGAKGVRKREEDGRTVYEVPFAKPIGFIGGRDGKRENNPDAKRLRLVVDGDQVITAFPF